MTDTAGYLRTLARAKAQTDSERWAEAAGLWEQVVAANPVNGNHWDRLAQARFESHDYAGALVAYEKVRDLGVWDQRETVFPSAVWYRIACCHARLGDAEEALRALGRAVELGLRDLEQASRDEHLASLHANERVREVLGLSDVDCAGRDEGWRADLRFFAREVRRRAYRPAGSHLGPAVDELHAAVPELSDAQLLVRLCELVATLGDGHAFVEAPEERADLRMSLPLQLFLFADGPFVTAAAPEHEALLGAQVLAFDGEPVERVVSAVDRTIGRDNEHGPTAVVPWRLVRTAFLPETLTEPLPLYLRNCGASYWYTSLAPQRLTYFQLNRVADDPGEPLAAFVERLFAAIAVAGSDRLVIDLRWNGGGNTFLPPPLLHRLIACDRVNRAGGLFVIIGRRTFSAAQNLATLIGDHTRAIFVGEPTGSSPTFVGEHIPFRLPYSGFCVNVSDLYWQTSWPLDHRSWIAPELYAPPTFAAYAANRDPAMEAILSCDEHLPGW